MRNIILSLAVFVASLFPLLYTAPAQALSARTWVSHTGSDSNTCTETSPCLTFNGALIKTSNGGEIDCLDPGDYSSDFHITISVTIDCFAANASTVNGNTGDGIDINAPGDIVVLRGLKITSIDAGTDIGINISAAKMVFIEDCVVMGFLSGINDVRTGGGTQLFIKNTVVRANLFNAGVGILAAAAATNSVALENVQSVGNGYGIAVATGNHVTISRSMMFGNSTAGIEVDAGGQVYIDNTEIANNGTGVEAFGNVALGNSGIVSNSTGISGTTTSYGNNRIFANSAAGTAPTLIGAVSPDYGQQ